MAAPKSSPADFIKTLEEFGPAQTARILGMGLRTVYNRRATMERLLKRPIKFKQGVTERCAEYPHRIPLDIQDGVVVVGSDFHYWPGIITTAHRAFVKFCGILRPKAVILNGDVLDGARVSRHPPIGWEETPTLQEEVETCKERTNEILKASPASEHLWTLGNHDGRFETRLATVAPEYAKIHGFHLKDHFPKWRPCWAVWVNDEVVIKHRWKGGIHATHNNTAGSGKSMVTGHLHSLKVTPYSDYNGVRFGVDTGTMADPYGPQFLDYTEDNPRNHRSGFAILTFHKGRLLWPELVHVIGPDEVEFRGKVITV